MKIPPKFVITPEILTLLSQIEAHQLFFAKIFLPDQLKTNIHHFNVLKSAVFSARIEGNELTIDSWEQSEESLSKKEIFNILETQNYIQNSLTANVPLTIQMITELHRKCMAGVRADAGSARTDQNAIFNSFGFVVYLPPPASQVPQLLSKLCDYVNQTNSFPLITASIAHFIFEKIHPFIDGNGRVGRLLFHTILKIKGYPLTYFVPFEENLENNSDQYYYYLASGEKDIEPYLMFMLTAYLKQCVLLEKNIQQHLNTDLKVILPPRQQEIYQIIRNHQFVSLDMIMRRFTQVPERTLRYDLQQLKQKKLIQKIGQTKGVVYTIISYGS